LIPWGIAYSYLFLKVSDNGHKQSISDLAINPLSPRQRQILAGFIEGKTNHEMATELGFSISTIRHETMAIFKTLGASDRKEAAKIAQQHGLI
jgi:DNA-binding NarL/FixJ family response regulator